MKPNQPITVGMKIRCHKNLHNGLWALTQRGKVIAYVADVVLSDVSFVYYESLRLKCVAMRRRKVCAYAQGVIATMPTAPRTGRLCFHPFRAATFTNADGVALNRCEYVEFNADGVAYTLGETK